MSNNFQQGASLWMDNFGGDINGHCGATVFLGFDSLSYLHNSINKPTVHKNKRCLSISTVLHDTTYHPTGDRDENYFWKQRYAKFRSTKSYPWTMTRVTRCVGAYGIFAPTVDHRGTTFNLHPDISVGETVFQTKWTSSNRRVSQKHFWKLNFELGNEPILKFETEVVFDDLTTRQSLSRARVLDRNVKVPGAQNHRTIEQSISNISFILRNKCHSPFYIFLIYGLFPKLPMVHLIVA